MEAEDRVSSLSISSSVLENSYGANVFFMRFHESDKLIYFISLLKQVHLLAQDLPESAVSRHCKSPRWNLPLPQNHVAACLMVNVIANLH